jgi:phosphate transport system protein
MMGMASLTEQAVRKALQALHERNPELAREVILGDREVDAEDNLLNEECLKMLALHQPVASDLRRITTAMVQVSLEAFAALDVRKARAVCRADDEVDRLNEEAIGELVAAMKSAPDAVEAGLSLFSVVRHLERVADHATNIAEDVVYLAEGAIIRHRPEAIKD